MASSNNMQTINVGGVGFIDTRKTWSTRSPKSDGIEAEKLSVDNLKRIGKDILDAGYNVTVGADSITKAPFNGGTSAVAYPVGQWLVREWDYRENRYTFRIATFDERVKYDLR